ncbi:endonuclease domain-containing protein [Parapedobacter sp. SGR-10]|uniref:endonuclease domain-containing protein n=1 Tax=Parapedobacter sp. SGR-10 TaxID=2710879 RepID=UPI0013CF8CA4|nr:endonuclease domain-containing protein [Parapedobacter sp. SGR-10]NGF56963.1 endonuclease domain-containing protein [Parapedobacter sp. SGR-10]
MEKANNSNHWNYNPTLRTFATRNRRDMTKAEACIWKYLLSGRRLMGYRFNRQRPIGNYIADFLCKELMLIIEVDGLTHQFEEVYRKDRAREQVLQEMGFTIIRFDDKEVLQDIANVERTLIHYIETHQSKP